MKREAKVLLAIMFAVIMLGGAASSSHAIFEAQDGCLVPYAYYSGNTDTMIGLMTWYETGFVYWSFMSPDGVQWGHGFIPANVAYKIPFSLKDRDGNAHPNLVGYLIFTYDDDETLQTTEDRNAIAANAVLLSANDAAFIPVIPLDRADYANTNLFLHVLNAGSIIGLSYGHPADQTVSVNYWIDPVFNAETSIVIWCSQTPPATFEAHTYSTTSFDSDDVTFNRDHTVLNVYDVETEMLGSDSGSVDGLVDIFEDQGGERFIFSLIKSSTFSAMQTMVGFYQP
jgi:hypothetical protein